jgi:hypothetical protein
MVVNRSGRWPVYALSSWNRINATPMPHLQAMISIAKATQAVAWRPFVITVTGRADGRCQLYPLFIRK